MVCCFLDTPCLRGLGDPRINYVSTRCEFCEKGSTACSVKEYLRNVQSPALNHSFNIAKSMLEAASFPLTPEDCEYLLFMEESEQAIDASPRDGENHLVPCSVVDASPRDGKTRLVPSPVIETKTDDETLEAVIHDEEPLPSKGKGKKTRPSLVLVNRSRETPKGRVDRMTPLLFNYSDAEEKKMLEKQKEPFVVVDEKKSSVVNGKTSVLVNEKRSASVNVKPSVMVNHSGASEQKTRQSRPSRHKNRTVIVNSSGKSNQVPDINSNDRYPRPNVSFGFMSGPSK